MTAKTPVSILHEYMSKQGITPMYELLQNSSGHDTIFRYIVIAGKVNGEGVGRSKKEARHNAALKALEVLARSDSSVRSELLMTSGGSSARIEHDDTKDDIAPVAVSPYAEKVTENSVGALAEICAEYNLGEPVYTVVSESGPAHAKTFSFCCTVQRLQEYGSSRTKKQAKQISAKRMVDKIKENISLPSSTLIEKPQVRVEQAHISERNVKAMEGYCLIKDKEQASGMQKNMSRSIGESHLILRELYSKQLTTLRAYAIEHSAEETVSRFASDNDINVSFTFIDSSEEGKSVCAASLSTSPEVVTFGTGRDDSTAKDLASINLLSTLMVMIANAKDELCN